LKLKQYSFITRSCISGQYVCHNIAENAAKIGIKTTKNQNTCKTTYLPLYFTFSINFIVKSIFITKIDVIILLFSMCTLDLNCLYGQYHQD